MILSRKIIILSGLSGIVLTGLLAWLNGCAANSNHSRLTAAELLQQIRNGQEPYIVDVREREELQGPLGALPDVKNIPMSEFEQRFGEIPRDRPVALICRSGNRSGQASTFLKGKGYTQVQNVEGGMLAVRRQ